MKNRLFKIIAVLVLSLLLVAIGCSCTTAAVSFNRDGSGTATIVIAKDGTLTQEALDAKLNEIVKGVGALSGDEDRLRIKHVEETADAYEVVVSFKRISYTKGLGDYDYMKSATFLLEEEKTTAVEKYSKGIYRKSWQCYTEAIYDFQNDKRGNSAVAFKPVDAITGNELDVDEFVSTDGILSQSRKGRMFTFFLADFPSVESITFSFAGTVKVYGSRGAELIDSSTVKVVPVVQEVVVTQFTEGSTTPVSERREVNVFAGYVYFELGPNVPLIIVLGAIGLAVIGLLVYSIVKGKVQSFFKGRTFKSIVYNYDLYLMLIPALVLLILFAYLPMGGVVMAFKNFKVDDGIWGSEWTSMLGFKHFVDLVTKPSSDFGSLALNTFILALLKFIFGFVCAILLAVLFSYLKNGIFKKTVQTISYFPYFISWVVISAIAYLFLASATAGSGDTSSKQGILNRIIMFFGAKPIQWYSAPQYWRAILTFTAIWKTVGYSTIVYLAAITAINPSLYEAAEIDGAGRWKQLLHVTVPGLFPVIGIQVIFSLGNLVKDDFDQIYTMTNGSAALSETTEVIGTIVYKSINSPSAYSDAAAMGLMQGVVGMIIVFASNKFMKKLGVEGVF